MNSLHFLCFPLLYLLLFHQKCVFFHNKLGLFLKLLPVEKHKTRVTTDLTDSFASRVCIAMRSYWQRIFLQSAKQKQNNCIVHTPYISLLSRRTHIFSLRCGYTISLPKALDACIVAYHSSGPRASGLDLLRFYR